MLVLFNACEAAFWWMLAIVVLLRYRQAESPLRRTARFAVVWLVLFGISDVIEMSTGAWWRPWPLLVFKGICLTGLTWSGWILLRAARRARTGGI